ncbi:reticulocalbin-2-like isoform X3 [Haliotis rufescens]|uniref:reticulocalbin-2-like isoform X3 n=1 Tax=Haliotis rufescens TaxID=6454 RepID=UPI001EB07F57|nr:reticulocalbin-2-like isoform X3 [Haliotis rufescens]
MRNRQLATTATSGSYKCTREHLRVQKELNRCFPFLDSSSVSESDNVRVTMKGFTCVLSMCLAMTLVLAVTKVNAENKEKIAPAAHAQHDPLGGVNETADGERNKHRDHEAVLGSREEAQDADDLTPEQAKNRLEKLAKTHDLDKDGRISKEEFITWILQSLKSLDEEEALKKLAEEDGDGDGKLAFGEYLKQQYDYSQEELKAIKEKPLDDDHKFMIETIGEDEKRFTAADQDKNGILDKSEYVAFMHPYDYEHMHAYEIEHRLKEFDQDNDTAVSLIEFLADEDDEDATSMDQLRFRKYDTDNDGFLKGDELKTWLTQGNLETATEEVEYLTSKADANKDGFLSLAEIRDHDEDFISSKATDYGDTLLKFKDEL